MEWDANMKVNPHATSECYSQKNYPYWQMAYGIKQKRICFLLNAKGSEMAAK